MREQVITPRAVSRNAAGRSRSGDFVQRPARRERSASAPRPRGSRVRAALAYGPAVAKITLAAMVGVLIFAGYRAAASASFFQVRQLEVSGTSRTSVNDIKAVVRRATQSGVWNADLAAISTEIERLPWVRTAIVARVLPDGLRVRITERVPRAVARTSAGRLIWVDEDGVSLGATSPADQLPAFFIRGWDESGTNAARAENRERLKRYLEMARDWEAAGLSERISEVNLDDLRDVRVQLAGADSQIEVRLGEKDFGSRLRRAVDVLDRERQTPRGAFITYLMPQETRTVIGTNSGAHTFGENTSSNPGNTETAEAAAESAKREEAKPNRRDSAAKKPTSRERKEVKAETARRADRRERKKDKKRATADEAKSQTRPRRVG